MIFILTSHGCNSVRHHPTSDSKMAEILVLFKAGIYNFAWCTCRKFSDFVSISGIL
jgi:hypothetical protein